MRDQRHRQAVAWRDLDAWLTWLELELKSPRTLYGYERAVAPLLRRHPRKRFSDFTSDDINTELTLVPPKSRYISRSIYNGWFEWGETDDRIDRSPMRKVAKMKALPRRPKDIFTLEEIALLVALPAPDGPLFQLLFFTGMRRGEARRLRRQHIDLNRGRMIVTGKGPLGGKERIIAFNPETAAAIATLDLFERLEPTDHLWYRKRYDVGDRRRRTDPIGDTTWDTWYRDSIRAAGVRMLNPHQTRHTYAQWLDDNNFKLEERQELLGHDSPNTTVRQYGRTNIEKIARKMVAL